MSRFGSIPVALDKKVRQGVGCMIRVQIRRITIIRFCKDREAAS